MGDVNWECPSCGRIFGFGDPDEEDENVMVKHYVSRMPQISIYRAVLMRIVDLATFMKTKLEHQMYNKILTQYRNIG